MKKLRAATAVLCLLAALPAGVSAAPSAPNVEQMKQFQFLLGTWNCTWKAGPDSGAVHLKFENIFNGSWIRETESRPARSGGFVDTAMHYTAYDPAKSKYIHLGPNRDGTYDIAESMDGVLWTDADVTLRLTKISDTELTEGADLHAGNQTIPYLQTCNKTS